MCEVPLYDAAPHAVTRERHQVTRPHTLLAGKAQTPSGLAMYRGTSLIRKHLPSGPYSRPTPMVLRRSQGGGAVSHERSTLCSGMRLAEGLRSGA